MPTLPASVRLSLWATAALAGRADLTEVPRRAFPDLDHVAGLEGPLRAWADIGERVVGVALPRPGRIATMPRSNTELVAAATEAGECVYVPATGSALVPRVARYGPAGDVGWQVTWQPFDAEPVPAHRLAELDAREIARMLRADMVAAAGELDAVDVQPWAGSGLRELADARTATARWGLPPGLDARSVGLIQQAGTVAAACELGLEHSPALGSVTHVRREQVLRGLLHAAEDALARAATAAALDLAGMRADRG